VRLLWAAALALGGADPVTVLAALGPAVWQWLPAAAGLAIAAGGAALAVGERSEHHD
jgi:hypothetical protein